MFKFLAGLIIGLGAAIAASYSYYLRHGPRYARKS